MASGAATGALTASPNPVTFGAVSIGQTASSTVSLLNGSSAPVEITQLNLTGQSFSLVSPSDFPVTIAAGKTYSLNVQFNPAATGTATGQLTVASNASTNGTAVIALTGTGMAAQPALSALSCSYGAMTGSGTEACTVTLTASAPSGGLIVNLSSSSSAVTVPSTVTVPAGAASAGFTASVSSVTTAQAATMTASAGGVLSSFTLQLNAAILALSINATSVAFGDVVVNTPSTQAVTLTSTGTVPVTIRGATLTGAGFAVSGTEFPATLNPGQAATLNVEFDPQTVGPATGQLTIASNSSTNGTAVIALTGTGTAAPVVAVAVTPAKASITTGATQQFTASVTGTSNTAVTWTVSGAGCSGATCGTISSSGLYTAPAAVPSPATVTVTATSASDPTKSASVTVTIVPPPGTKYYLAPAAAGGNDSNNGLSRSAPWLTPNHALNCGDVIIAAPSTAYSGGQFDRGEWGTVTCPAGNNVAWLTCATFDACKVTAPPNLAGMSISASYWGVSGWEATSPGAACFIAQPATDTSSQVHHVIIANNIANGCYYGGVNADTMADGSAAGVDYIALVGNIAYNSVSGGPDGCTSAFNIWAPINLDSLPGTHIYVAGNFAWGNVDGNPCSGVAPLDGEGLFFDTFDEYSYTGQTVADNNILVFNGGRGFNVLNNGGSPVYFRHNTAYGNNTEDDVYVCAEGLIDQSSNVESFLNLVETGTTSGCGGSYTYAAYQINQTGANGAKVKLYSNYGYSAAGNNISTTGTNTGFVAGPNNTFANPQFANPVEPGAPSCSGYANVPACMAAVIADFTPTNPAAAGYGYQIPSSTPVYDPLFPQWLCNVNLPTGLVTMGCQTSP